MKFGFFFFCHPGRAAARHSTNYQQIAQQAGANWHSRAQCQNTFKYPKISFVQQSLTTPERGDAVGRRSRIYIQQRFRGRKRSLPKITTAVASQERHFLNEGI